MTSYIIIQIFRQGESQLLDYQTQQDKLFPALATTYAFHVTSSMLIMTYLEVESEIASGNIDRLSEVSGQWSYHNMTI